MQITDILLEQLDVCISILVCMLSSGPEFFDVGPIVPPGSLLPRGSETERHTRNSKADVRSFQIPKRRKTFFYFLHPTDLRLMLQHRLSCKGEQGVNIFSFFASNGNECSQPWSILLSHTHGRVSIVCFDIRWMIQCVCHV